MNDDRAHADAGGLHQAARSEAAKTIMTGTSKSPGCPDPRAILHHSKERRVAQEISDQRTLVAPAGPMVE
jgi:hypothetical protein